MIKNLNLIFLASVLLLSSHSVWALKTDSDQPIDISANQLEINDAKKISTYIGKVKLKQGSLNITADRLILYFDDKNELDYMEISGSPARLTQLNEDNKIMRGSAQKILYEDKKSLLTLTVDAIFSSEKEHITSHYIQVNTENDRIKAGKNDNNHRVRIKILPRNKN